MNQSLANHSASKQTIAIIDCGSQYTQLIARKIRQLNVHAQVFPHTVSYSELVERDMLIGIILSGGPESVYETDIALDERIWKSNTPILGICFGQQLIGHYLKGVVEQGESGEYGGANVDIIADSVLFQGIEKSSLEVWMSHSDTIVTPPAGFVITSKSSSCPVTSMENPEDRIYSLQFHPEVTHTQEGLIILENFLRKVCYARFDFDILSGLENRIAALKEQVGDEKVILGLSGGVDSSVCAGLLHRAIGDKLHAILVDNGLLRKNEAKQVENMMNDAGISISVVDASDLFLRRIGSHADPEKKRKIIGATFIEVFEHEAVKLDGVKWLAQGTIYPDIIESARSSDSAHVIKSHHNVGGLPDVMNLKLLEPLSDLFKDEVRMIGRQLGLPSFLVDRHPFPGPGLAVRCLDEIKKSNLDILRECDAILLEELHASGWYEKTSQAFAVLLPCYSTGVVGDRRRYERVVALRCIDTSDFMTGNWSPLPYELLNKISARIINEVSKISRVVYDISSKPPATIEWE